eukprot:5579556-Pyramimonas_sp.AAC.1
MDPSDLFRSAIYRWTAKESERSAKVAHVEQLESELIEAKQQLSRLEAETSTLSAEVAQAQSAVAAGAATGGAPAMANQRLRGHPAASGRFAGGES